MTREDYFVFAAGNHVATGITHVARSRFLHLVSWTPILIVDVNRLDAEKRRENAQHVHCQLFNTSPVLPCATPPNTPAIRKTPRVHGAKVSFPSQVLFLFFPQENQTPRLIFLACLELRFLPYRGVFTD